MQQVKPTVIYEKAPPVYHQEVIRAPPQVSYVTEPVVTHTQPQRVSYRQEVVRQDVVRQEPVVNVQPARVSYRQEQPRMRNETTSNVNEYKTYVGEGERVLVETRTYSPNREPRIEKHQVEDWARYSQAHWREH